MCQVSDLREARLTCEEEVLNAIFLQSFHLFALWRLAIFMVPGQKFGILHGPSSKVLCQCKQVLLQILWRLQVWWSTRQGKQRKPRIKYIFSRMAKSGSQQPRIFSTLNHPAADAECICSCKAFARDDCIKSCLKMKQ